MPAQSGDVRLDRLVHFDPRSRDYPVRALLLNPTPRSYTWSLDITLDQGSEGECVGFSMAHELRAKPKVVAGVTAQTAHDIYHRARQLDQWPGEDYSGTSVLAGAKALQERGELAEYRWAFSVDDLAAAVSRIGPAVLGIHWYTGMYQPAYISSKYGQKVTVSGTVAGDHAILCRAYSLTRGAFLLHNSWGPTWGAQGTAWISREDVDRLLHEDGEGMIPIRR